MTRRRAKNKRQRKAKAEAKSKRRKPLRVPRPDGAAIALNALVSAVAAGIRDAKAAGVVIDTTGEEVSDG